MNLTSHSCHSHLHITLANESPHRTAMVMAGENVANDVDEEVHVIVRRAIANADQAGPRDISGDTRSALTLRTPEPPTDAARTVHNTTHVPFRDCCPICVASRGRSSPHRRVVVDRTADTLPKFQADYMFIRTAEESKTQPCITVVETRSGAVISFMSARKGGYEDMRKEILRHFEAYGFLNPVIVQCDKEMSIMPKSCTREKGENGVKICARIESSEQRVCRSSARTHTGTRTMLPDTNRDEHWHTASAISPAIPFAVRYAGFVLSRFTPDGRTPFQYFFGTPYVSPLCMLGESVFALIPDQEVRASKLTNRWISGCWWGRDASSDEHLVGTKFGLLKCRSVRRKPLGEQWSRRETVEA